MAAPDPALAALREVWPRILAPTSHTDAAKFEAATDAAWGRVATQALAHGLGSLFVWQMRERNLWSRVPPAAREALRGVEITDAMGTLRRRSCLMQALDALRLEGIAALPYKGTVLAHRAYPAPATRPMVDIDLWIEARDMPRAVAALTSIGFTPAADPDHRPQALQALHDGEVKLRHAGLGTLELHWGLFAGFWLAEATRIERDEIAARFAPGSVLEREVLLPAPRDHLALVALHAAINNRHGLAGLRGLLDVALIADEIDEWDAPLQDYARWRIGRVMAHSLQLAGELFDRPALLDVSARLQRAAPIAALMRLVDANKILDARRTSGALARWSFLLGAVDGWQDALRLGRSAVWPSGEWLQARYGRGGLVQRLAHLPSHAVWRLRMAFKRT